MKSCLIGALYLKRCEQCYLHRQVKWLPDHFSCCRSNSPVSPTPIFLPGTNFYSSRILGLVAVGVGNSLTAVCNNLLRIVKHFGAEMLSVKVFWYAPKLGAGSSKSLLQFSLVKMQALVLLGFKFIFWTCVNSARLSRVKTPTEGVTDHQTRRGWIAVRSQQMFLKHQLTLN